MNKKLSALFALIIGSWVSVCGAQSVKEAQDMSKAHVTRIKAEPLWQRLDGKISASALDGWTIDQLADIAIPDESQKEAIIAIDRIASANAAEAVTFMKNWPVDAAILRDYFSATQDNRLALYEGKLTFGEYNQVQKKLFDLRQRIFADREEMQNQQSRQAWAAAFNAIGASYLGASSQQRTTTNTNCNAIGGTLSCRSTTR